MNTEIDTTQMTIDQQLDYLFEGTYFADEAGGVEGGDNSLRAQMRAELKKKLRNLQPVVFRCGYTSA